MGGDDFNIFIFFEILSKNNDDLLVGWATKIDKINNILLLNNYHCLFVNINRLFFGVVSFKELSITIFKLICLFIPTIYPCYKN
jgi:hypothetical protein